MLDDKFKFRVWDKERLCFRKCFMINRHGDLCKLSENYLALEIIENEERYIFQECTSIEDINRNFIYVGDILNVKLSHGMEQMEVRGINSYYYLYTTEDFLKNSPNPTMKVELNEIKCFYKIILCNIFTKEMLK